MRHVIVFFFSYFLSSILCQDTIWYQECSTLDTSNWTKITGSTITMFYGSQITESSNSCAYDGFCWRVCGDNSVYSNGYIYRNAVSTKGYKNISLTFDVDPHSMTQDGEYCSLSYSIDSSITSWTEFYRVTGGSTHIVAHTEYLDQVTWDNDGVAIKLLVMYGSGDCCHISRVSFNGYPITTTTTTTNPMTTINVITYRTITGTFYDNYETLPPQGWVVYEDGIAYDHTVMVSSDTARSYHIFKPDSEPDTDIFKLEQLFYCNEASDVSISYNVYYCNTEQTDYVRLYLNGDLKEDTSATFSDDGGNGIGWTDTDLLSICNVNCCGPDGWETMGPLGPYTMDSVDKGILFNVTFEIALSADTERLGISGITITCTPNGLSTEPTTIAPSTSIPTTAKPTIMPTTIAPSTAKPTTKAPITTAPTTTPTTTSPTTTSPTTTAPTTTAPTTAAPTKSPTTTEPTIHDPTTNPPTTAEPTTSTTTTSTSTTSSSTTSTTSTSTTSPANIRSHISPAPILEIGDKTTTTTLRQGAIEETKSTQDQNTMDGKDQIDQDLESFEESNLFIYIIIGGILCFCLIICIIFIIAKKRKTKKLYLKEKARTVSEIQLSGYNQYNPTSHISASSPSSPSSPAATSLHSTQKTVPSAFAQRVNSLSSVEGNHFEATLTNLAGANSLLMDDVIADMADNDNDNDDIIITDDHITAGGDVIDMNESEETDETNQINMNNDDDDATPPTNENNYIDNDENVLGGFGTIGNDNIAIPPPPPPPSPHEIQNNNNNDDDDNNVLMEIETMGGDINNNKVTIGGDDLIIDSDVEGGDEHFINNINEDPQIIGDDEIIDDGTTALPPPPPRSQ